jgi:hypothetical protein
MTNVASAVALALLAGILNGSFATPMKYAKVWKWENIWAVWAVVGMFLFPWLIVFLTVPNMSAFYNGVDARQILLLVGFGVGFGLAQIFFGLGIAALGIALNFAIAIGLSTALGSLIGVAVGLASGYLGGWVDLIVQRIVDILQALPLLVLALVMAASLGPSLKNTVIAIAIPLIPYVARVIRANTLALRELPDPPPLHLAAVRLTSEHWHCGCVVVGTTSDLLRKGSVGPEPSLHAGGPSFPAGPGEIVILARPFTFRERLLYPLLKE